MKNTIVLVWKLVKYYSSIYQFFRSYEPYSLTCGNIVGKILCKATILYLAAINIWTILLYQQPPKSNQEKYSPKWIFVRTTMRGLVRWVWKFELSSYHTSITSFPSCCFAAFFQPTTTSMLWRIRHVTILILVTHC